MSRHCKKNIKRALLNEKLSQGKSWSPTMESWKAAASVGRAELSYLLGLQQSCNWKLERRVRMYIRPFSKETNWCVSIFFHFLSFGLVLNVILRGSKLNCCCRLKLFESWGLRLANLSHGSHPPPWHRLCRGLRLALRLGALPLASPGRELCSTRALQRRLRGAGGNAQSHSGARGWWSWCKSTANTTPRTSSGWRWQWSRFL